MSDKTIQEFANEVGVTKQAIHYRFKDLPSKERKKNSQNIIVLTEEEQAIIKDLLGIKSQRESTVSSQTKENVKSYFDDILTVKNEQIDLLKQLLSVKDNRIDDLLNKQDNLTKLLDQQQQLTLNLQTKIDVLTFDDNNNNVLNKDELIIKNSKKDKEKNNNSWWSKIKFW